MASLYDSLSRTATKLVDKLGKSVTITRTINATFDPVTGTETSARTQAQKVNAVIMPASGSKVSDLDLKYNLQGQDYKRMAYFIAAGADLTWTPEPGEKVKIGNDTWVIVGATPLNPNTGDPLTYEVAIRI